MYGYDQDQILSRLTPDRPSVRPSVVRRLSGTEPTGPNSSQTVRDMALKLAGYHSYTVYF